MNQEKIKTFLLKLSHDLAGQRRCLDLVNLLLHEGSCNIEDAKKLLTETIEQFDLTQNNISSIQFEKYEETTPENGISQIKGAKWK